MMARRGSMLPTFLVILGLLFLGYVGMSYWHVRKALEETRLKAKQYQQQQESLTAQLQVVYEHRSRLEKILQNEKSEHKNTREDFESRMEKVKKESQNRYNSVNVQHKMLQTMHEDLKAELDEAKQKHSDAVVQHEREKFEHDEDLTHLERDKEEEVHNLRIQLAAAQEEVNKISDLHQQAAKSLQQRDQDIEMGTIEKDQLNQQILRLSDDNAAYKNENARLANEHNTLHSKAEEYKQHIEQLNQLNRRQIGDQHQQVNLDQDQDQQQQQQQQQQPQQPQQPQQQPQQPQQQQPQQQNQPMKLDPARQKIYIKPQPDLGSFDKQRQQEDEFGGNRQEPNDDEDQRQVEEQRARQQEQEDRLRRENERRQQEALDDQRHVQQEQQLRDRQEAERKYNQEQQQQQQDVQPQQLEDRGDDRKARDMQAMNGAVKDEAQRYQDEWERKRQENMNRFEQAKKQRELDRQDHDVFQQQPEEEDQEQQQQRAMQEEAAKQQQVAIQPQQGNEDEAQGEEDYPEKLQQQREEQLRMEQLQKIKQGKDYMFEGGNRDVHLQQQKHQWGEEQQGVKNDGDEEADRDSDNEDRDEQNVNKDAIDGIQLEAPNDHNIGDVDNPDVGADEQQVQLPDAQVLVPAQQDENVFNNKQEDQKNMGGFQRPRGKNLHQDREM